MIGLGTRKYNILIALILSRDIWSFYWKSAGYFEWDRPIKPKIDELLSFDMKPLLARTIWRTKCVNWWQSFAKFWFNWRNYLTFTSGYSSLKSSRHIQIWKLIWLTMVNLYDELSKSKDKSITKVSFNLGNNAHKK